MLKKTGTCTAKIMPPKLALNSCCSLNVMPSFLSSILEQVVLVTQKMEETYKVLGGQWKHGEGWG